MFVIVNSEIVKMHLMIIRKEILEFWTEKEEY